MKDTIIAAMGGLILLLLSGIGYIFDSRLNRLESKVDTLLQQKVSAVELPKGGA
jgi:hypothetical protein